MKCNSKKAPADFNRQLDAETRLFVQLVLLLGYPQAYAYQIAFPKSSASACSAAAIGCRLMQDLHVREYARMLERVFANREKFLNPKIIGKL